MASLVPLCSLQLCRQAMPDDPSCCAGAYRHACAIQGEVSRIISERDSLSLSLSLACISESGVYEAESSFGLRRQQCKEMTWRTHSELGLAAAVVCSGFLLTLAHGGKGGSAAVQLNGSLVSEEL